MDAFYTIPRNVMMPHTERPGHDGQLQRQHLMRMNERMSESEEEEDSDFDSFDTDENFGILNLNPAYGQTVALWSFLKYDSIAIFPSGGNNLFHHVIEYAEQHLGYKRFEHRLMFLSPGKLSPVSLRSIFNIRPGGVVMVMPEDYANITIEISQLKTSFTLTVDFTMSVQKIKSYIQKRKGIPIERQEILYANRPLENHKRLMEYRVKSRSTLYVMIQGHFDLLINVTTFWGKTYRFYIDPCSTGTDIVYAVFNRAFSASGPEDAGLHELYVPIHILVLQYENKLVNWDYCVAYLGIHTGETLNLSTVGHHSNMRLEDVNVVTETGEKYTVTVSQYDRWSILAFMLHGLTNIPVDLIRLYMDGKRVDFSSTIGELEKHHVVLMNVVMTHMDSDLVFGVPLKISIGNGIIENVRISAKKTIRSLKRKLEKMGVPNASLYELTIANQKLPNHKKIMDLVFDLTTPLVLKLESYPVFAHAPDGVIYKTFLKVNQTIANFKQKIEVKTGFSVKHSRLIIAGKELLVHPHSVLYEVGVSCRNSIFFLPSQDFEGFFVLGNNWLERIRIPLNPTSMDIRNAVWNARKLSEGTLNCVLTILYWFFIPRISDYNKTQTKTRIKKRMPIARETLQEFKDFGKLTYDDKEQMGKIKPRAINSSPYPGSDFKSRPRSNSKVKHHRITNQFESNPFLNLNTKHEAGGKSFRHNSAKLPEIYDSPRSMVPAWMKNLQARHTSNRLIMGDGDGGPNGMASFHQSRTQQIRKQNEQRIIEPTNIPLNLDLPNSAYKVNSTNNFSRRNRFMYNHQHFDFIASEDGHDDQSESIYPQNVLPKI